MRIEISGKFTAPSLDSGDLVQIGTRGIRDMLNRLANGIGLDDRKMPRYSERYAIRKVNRGKSPIVRNLEDSGAMLNSLTVISVSDDQVRIGFNRRSEYIKAMANQSRTPWFGMSSNDQTDLLYFIQELYNRKKSS